MPLLRSAEWLAAADRWSDHRHSAWAQVARRSPEGHHLGYVTAERPYWGAYDQIEVNNQGWLNFAVIDVDGADAVERALDCPSPPSWVVPTPHGAHAGWVVDSVRRDRIKAVRYYNAVRENLRRAVNGDPGYGQHGTRNPLCRCTPPSGVTSAPANSDNFTPSSMRCGRLTSSVTAANTLGLGATRGLTGLCGVGSSTTPTAAPGTSRRPPTFSTR